MTVTQCQVCALRHNTIQTIRYASHNSKFKEILLCVITYIMHDTMHDDWIMVLLNVWWFYHDSILSWWFFWLIHSWLNIYKRGPVTKQHGNWIQKENSGPHIDYGNRMRYSGGWFIVFYFHLYEMLSYQPLDLEGEEGAESKDDPDDWAYN